MSGVDRAAAPDRRHGPSLTAWSLAALAAGLLLGLLGHRAGAGHFEGPVAVARTVGDLWIAALQMMVVPLMIAYTLAAIVGAGGGQAVGALTGRAVLLFVAMLAGAAAVTLALTPLIVRLYPADPATIAALTGRTAVPESVREMASAGYGSFGSWISALVPRNLFESAARGEILPLLLFALLVGIAITRLSPEQREPLSRILQGLAEAMLICVRWILALTPVGVLALTFLFALGAGGDAVGVLGAWAVIASGMLLLCTILLYPVTVLVGRTSLLAFARAAAPAQLVAATTRSSIASLPALVQGAREHLDLPATATGLVLPLGVSLLKLSQIVANLTKFVFLAHVCGVSLGAAKIATFLLIVAILSFSTAGLPSRGAMRSLPAYMAAGIPIEAVVIVDTIEAIPDIFQTVLNVTGHMSAATLLSRSSRAPRRAGAVAGVGPAARVSESE
ncbi:MAG: dicarboxylate/amino acid:cation symporter [Acidobacteriota bacterium]